MPVLDLLEYFYVTYNDSGRELTFFFKQLNGLLYTIGCRFDGTGDTQCALFFMGDVSKPKDFYLVCLPHILEFIFRFHKSLHFIVVKSKPLLPKWIVDIISDEALKALKFTLGKTGEWSLAKRNWKKANE